MDKKVGGPAGLVGYSEELSHDIVELDQNLLGNKLFGRHSSLVTREIRLSLADRRKSPYHSN
jgi:hypothetical protein